MLALHRVQFHSSNFCAVEKGGMRDTKWASGSTATQSTSKIGNGGAVRETEVSTAVTGFLCNHFIDFPTTHFSGCAYLIYSGCVLGAEFVP